MTPPPADPQATLFDGAGAASGVPERLLAATPTRLSGWLSCRRRYRFTYLERPARRGAPWARTSVGAAVHTALARWWQVPAPLRTPGRAGALVAVAWIAEGFRDAAQSAAARERAADMVARYVATLDPQAEPRAVERTVGTRTAVLALTGRVDRLDERLVERPDEQQVGRSEAAAHELVVVDYKTGRHVPTIADVRSSLALAVYAVAAARTFRRFCRRVELHHLPSGRVVAHDHDARSLAAHLRRADAVGLELREAARRWDEGLSRSAVESLFPPAPGPGCAWCDFRGACPEGARASHTLPPWAGLDEVEHLAGTDDAVDLGNAADIDDPFGPGEPADTGDTVDPDDGADPDEAPGS